MELSRRKAVEEKERAEKNVIKEERERERCRLFFFFWFRDRYEMY